MNGKRKRQADARRIKAAHRIKHRIDNPKPVVKRSENPSTDVPQAPIRHPSPLTAAVLAATAAYLPGNYQ